MYNMFRFSFVDDARVVKVVSASLSFRLVPTLECVDAYEDATAGRDVVT